jgi:aminoglycoside phosphotransferase (APT) family kinase protein
MRDGIVLTAGLLRESCRLAAERWWGRGNAPRAAAEVKPEWLTHALQADFPGVRVRGLDAIDQHAGTTDRARLRVTYDDAGTGPPPPPSVFVKAAPPDFKTRLFLNVMGIGSSEVRFYREIAPDLPIERPRVFHACMSGPAQRFVLVLEDLAARGAHFADVTTQVTVERARSVVRELARLHARFWNSPRLRSDLAWLRAPDRRPHAAAERCVCALAAAPALRRFADVVPAGLRAAGSRIMAARDEFESVWARGPLTVVHGDAHIGNMYFLPETVGLLDWQVVQCCQGMRDVTYFLIGSVSSELRRAHQRDLIGDYLSTLRDHGVAAPDFDEAWMQYRLHAPWIWIASVVTAASATLQAESIARAALSRSSAALLELDSLGALEAGC